LFVEAFVSETYGSLLYLVLFENMTNLQYITVTILPTMTWLVLGSFIHCCLLFT